MRALISRAVLLSLIILGLFLVPGLLSARAAIVYVPGVKPGDTAIYAKTVGTWNLPGPPSSPFNQFIGLNFTTLSVSNVHGSNVTAAQTFFYINGTTKSGNILGSVATDSGNITFWFTAANLTEGDPIYTTPNAPVINRTMTLVFAGAPRLVNIFNATNTFPGGAAFTNAWWDQKTGILVHFDFAIKTSTGNAFVGADLVRTSLWNPASTREVGLFALPNPLLIAQGFSNSSILHLLSEQGFSGNVSIGASTPGCLSMCPIVTVNPHILFLLGGGQTFAVLNVSTTPSTGLGFYSVLVTVTNLSSSLIVNSTTVGVNVVSSGTDEFPTAMLHFSPLNPSVGQPVLFSGAGSFDPDGSIVSYNFTFSDFTHIIVGSNTTSVTHSFASPGSYNVILTVTDTSNLKGFAFASVNVAGNQTDEPPIADFFVRVSNASLPIRAGQLVTFDGSPSSDPDGFITFYSWNFGDGLFGSGQFAGHVYSSPGNYTVSLTVTDSSSKTASVQHLIIVLPAVMHDVGIVGVDPEPKTVVSGQQVFVRVDLVNLGLQPENVDVTVRFNGQVAASQHFTNVPVTGSLFPYSVDVVWDTTGVAAGNYTISASVFLATDQNPSNNQFTDGQVSILPPPVLTATPSQGPVGTKVALHGSGFAISNQQFQFLSIEVTFDDQFVGVEQLTNSSSFDFVFNVPVAQVGPHMIHVYVQLFPGPIEVSTGFTVVPGPGNVSLTVGVGSIYFPGDTAVVYVLSTANGAPANAGSISLLLVLPNGTSRNLALVSVSTGVYKASFMVPSKNSIGTYGLVASSQLNGSSSSALSSFEVKPTWLQSNGRTLATGTAVVGVAGTLGVVALAWRKGLLTKRKEEFPFS